MSDILLLASIIMLVLLFLKVPVYIAVLGGAMVYFVMNQGVILSYLPSRRLLEQKKYPFWPFRFLCVRGYL